MPIEIHEKLKKYAQSKKINIGLILSQFISRGVEYDIFDEAWIEKLVRASQVTTGIAAMVGECSGLASGMDDEKKVKYSCVFYRPGKPPQIRILGNESLAGGRCLACGKTKADYLLIMEKDERIIELEGELRGRATEVFKVPKCNRGAVLFHDEEDRLIMRDCFRNRTEAVAVDTYCRVQSNGLPCMFFAELPVGVST